MIRIVQIIILLFYTAYLFAQQPTQTLRGQVTDEASGIPLPFVNVHLQNTDIGTTTDDNGNSI